MRGLGIRIADLTYPSNPSQRWLVTSPLIPPPHTHSHILSLHDSKTLQRLLHATVRQSNLLQRKPNHAIIRSESTSERTYFEHERRQRATTGLRNDVLFTKLCFPAHLLVSTLCLCGNCPAQRADSKPQNERPTHNYPPLPHRPSLVRLTINDVF